MSGFENEFKNPGCEFRGKPFWAWNGKLEKKELLRQMDVFKEMGMGGAFMHARVGLGTPYLSKEWFDLIDACARKAKEAAMQAWLYDEDRWPSGAAGGLVTKEERFRMRFLRVDVVSDLSTFKATGKEIALFSAKMSGRNASAVKRLAKDAKPVLAKGESLLVFTEEPHPLTEWYNGYSYLDTMNEAAVDKFVEVTHEQYLKNNGKDFGKTIPGIFADEPHYGAGRNYQGTQGTANWTGSLPAAFLKRYGYDLLDHLPEIFYRVDGASFSKARRDYRDCITHLFVNAFGRKIYEFCEKAGIDFTGHVLEEPSLESQTQAVGAAMRFYEYMQAPGIDILCAQGLTRDGGGSPEVNTAKQCESMRHQFGRKRMLSELYGCTGWNFTFAEHKAVGDWQAAMGVNLRCMHLAWYTMEGEAKRDYPASISFQSAWWRSYRAVEDYFSRVNAALASGEAVRDVAVLHPIESEWGLYLIRDNDKELNKTAHVLDKTFKDVQDTLLAAHCDYDFIDEDILSRYGSVEGAKLKVNLASYKVVVVPPILCVREGTAKLLADFQKAGGKVILLENPKELAALEQGGPLNSVKAIAKKVKLGSLASAVERTGIDRIAVKDKSGKEYGACFYMLRRDAQTGNATVFLSHNLQDKSSGSLELSIPATGKAYELDATTGRILEIKDAKTVNGSTVIKTSLEPYGSRLFVVGSLKADGVRENLSKSASKALALKNCKFALSEQNAIALDTADVRINEKWNGPFEVLRLDRVVRDAVGLPYRSGSMVQPWARKPVVGAKEGHAVEVSFKFKVETMPKGKVWLALERPGEYTCKLNEKSVVLKSEGWWLDNSIYKVALPEGSLVEGWNDLKLQTSYNADSGFEALYLIGDFGSSYDSQGFPVLKALPEKLGLGDWADYGLATYTGALSYFADAEIAAKKGERVFLKFGKWEGIMAEVLVDGKLAGSIAWPPYELDLTDALSGKGKAKLEIRLYSGRRNLLGPLHHAVRHPVWTGPGEFVSDSKSWSPEPLNFPIGLMDAPTLVVKK